MPTRKVPEAVEGESAEAPGMVPEGVEADVTVKYRRRVNPAETDLSTLDELAANEASSLTPPDALSAFLEEWADFIGYPCGIVRLPDPASRRMPGNYYARPCFELERLGDTPFDPVNFIPTLQMLNGYSGGVFRIWLMDQNGAAIPEARLDRYGIADPPRSGAGNRAGSFEGGYQRDGVMSQPAPPQERQQSAIEKQMANLQTRLLETALERALNPPAPPPPPPSAPELTQEQQLAMAVFSQSDLLSSVIQKVATAVQSPETTATPTWKDKAFDYLLQNPAIGDRIAGVADRLVGAIANFLPGAPSVSEPPQPPVQHAPQSTPGAQASNLPPEVPQSEPIDADEGEEEDMAILDELLALLNGTQLLTLTDPVFARLNKEHPARFPLFARGLAAMPLEQLIETIKQQSPLYQSLLESPVTGAHLQQRIAELQALAKGTPAPPTQETNAPAA